MAQTVKLLTALEVGKLKGPGMYAVGPTGLFLQVKSATQRSWIGRYQKDGKARWAGLGSADSVGLADARTKWQEIRAQVSKGIDPVAARKEERERRRTEARPSSKPFRQVAAEYIANHESEWRSDIHRRQWTTTLQMYAYPVIGDLAPDEITTEHAHTMLQPIWQTTNETARRVRGRCEKILDYARVRGLRRAGEENPFRWTGHLDQVFPKRKKQRDVKHHAAMPYSALPGFMERLREREGIATRALEFCILTAARTGEALGATWAEVDLAAKTWTVPADRIKGGVQHRVPLSGRAIEIIEEMAAQRRSELIFPGLRGELSNMSMSAVLKRMGHGDVTVHGFRSSFRDWAAETTGYPNHVVEMALAHAIGSEVEAAYRRGDLFAKRALLMAEWAKYCKAPVKGNVIELPAAAKKLAN